MVADIAVNNRSVYICNPPSSSECLSITMSCGMGPAPMPDVCSHYVQDNPTASSVLLPSSPSIGSGIANVPQRSFDVLTAAQAELEAYAREYELAEDVVAKLAKLLRNLVPVENGRSRS